MEGCPSGHREQTVNLPAHAFGGSNPPPSTTQATSTEPRGRPKTTRTAAGGKTHAGVAQLVELQPSKLVVEGSSPFARSNESPEVIPSAPNHHLPHLSRPRSTVAVHFLGKEGVASSILAEGSAT